MSFYQSKQINRGGLKRSRRKFVIFSAEGKNETEKKYLLGLNSCQSICKFIYANGNSTDPVGLIENIVSKKKQCERIGGDVYASLIDLDNSPIKIKQLSEAKKEASKHNIKFIVSNPSFEFWFLEHFEAANSPYANQKQLIKDLLKYIGNYCKNMDALNILLPRTGVALKNDAINKKNHLLSKHNDYLSLNPYTEVNLLISKLNIA